MRIETRAGATGRARATLGRGCAFFVLITAVAHGAAASPAASHEAAGDAAWEQRSESRTLTGAPIRESIAAYDRALSLAPSNLEARWKLLRALHFDGDFESQDPAEKRRIFERGRDLAEEGLDLVAAQLGGGERLDTLATGALAERLASSDVASSDIARLYFWSAIHWGAWSRDAGLLSAVRQGVANRLQRYALLTLALEPEYEEGGAYRLLGSLHAELPRVPFVSGWVDRSRAIELLEEAQRIEPDHPGTLLLLARALLELEPERRDEAIVLLERACALRARPAMRVEDLAVQREAHQQLRALQSANPSETS